MARQHSELRTGSGVIARTMGGLSAIVLMLGLSQAGCAVNECLNAAARVVLGALPSMVLAGWHAVQAAQACGNSPWLAGLLLRISGCCWSAIATLVGGA